MQGDYSEISMCACIVRIDKKNKKKETMTTTTTAKKN